MRILFVSDVSIHQVIGGAERVLSEQATRLRQRGHSVHILTRRLAHHENDHDIIGGVHEWRYEVTDSCPLSFLASTLINSRRLFRSLQRRFSFNCINVHQPFSALSIISSRSARGIPTIYTCHSLSFEEFQSRNPIPRPAAGRIFHRLNRGVRRCVEGRILKRSDRIVVLSRFTRDKVERTYGIPGDAITIIHGGVDIERFHPAADRREIRRRLDLPPDGLIVLTVRNMVPRMGLDTLLRAFSDVIADVPDVRLVLGGEGPLKDDLVTLARDLGIAEHTIFAGFVPESELPHYYQMADIFVLPTRELEGFGLVTLESLACGVPVLGTPVGGTVEILDRLDRGYIFRDTGSEAMAALITRICRAFRDNPAYQSDVASRCRTFVEEHFSWDRNVTSLERLFSHRGA